MLMSYDTSSSTLDVKGLGHMDTLSIGEVARRAGIRPSAIRYYESVRLLPAPRRLNGRRRYGPDVLIRLTVVRMAREAGFTVAETRGLFHDFPEDAPASDRWRALAGRKIDEMDALLARAQRMRDVLEQSLRCGCLSFDDCAGIGWHDTDRAAGAPGTAIEGDEGR